MRRTGSRWPSRRRSTNAARSSPRPAPASARPSPTWCRCCCRGGARSSAPRRRACRTSSSCATCRACAQALGVPVRMALLKGRASYLCRHRLVLARDSTQLPDRFAVRALARVETWAQATKSGDLAEIDGLDDRSPVIPLVTSTRENCLGTECPEHRACHVMAARREAMAADLVVVNHHLFFADMALARQRRRRAAAHRRRGGVRRSAPARRGRRAVPGHDARHRRR